jgi:5-formyltetrahydrofolate cyclo-ligase
MDKVDLRLQFRDAPGPAPEVGSLVVEGLFRWMSARLPGTVIAYLAMRDEIDVEPLFERLPGWRWMLPRIEDDLSLTLRDRSLPREAHRWGMEQPVDMGDPVPVHEVDLILAPGLAFDRSGMRLGRGGGFYDRLLATRRNDCLVVGVTWSERVVDAVPFEDHDQRVGFIATETGVTPSLPRN